MEEKFICLECGSIFEVPKLYSFDTQKGLYQYEACPNCEGAYRKAEQCQVCMDWKLEETGEYIDDNFICEDCYLRLETID